jgi:hypothetical protein
MSAWSFAFDRNFSPQRQRENLAAKTPRTPRKNQFMAILGVLGVLAAQGGICGKFGHVI